MYPWGEFVSKMPQGGHLEPTESILEGAQRRERSSQWGEPSSQRTQRVLN